MTAGQGIEQRLAQGVVLGAEGYVFELERRGYIKAGPYVPEVVLDFPGAVSELHRMPTMESLRADGTERVFPLALEPFSCTRFDMAAFAAAARDLGVDYIGVCCGGAPHQVRAMAEALGREVPASRYAPAMELHPILGAGSPAIEANVLAAWNVAG